MENKNELQAGAWDKEIKPYPEKVTFELDVPVRIKFADNFERPEEKPQINSDGVFYLFNVTIEGVDRTLMTSAWTLLKGLKSKEPLNGKEIIITKKNDNGKNQFYIEDPSEEPQPVEATEEDY